MRVIHIRFDVDGGLYCHIDGESYCDLHVCVVSVGGWVICVCVLSMCWWVGEGLVVCSPFPHYPFLNTPSLTPPSPSLTTPPLPLFPHYPFLTLPYLTTLPPPHYPSPLSPFPLP